MSEEKKTMLVTGGNRGIGLAIVEGLSSMGHRVLLGGRNLASATEAASSLHGDVVPVQMDLSNRETLGKQVNEIFLNHPPIDVLINNAGILEYGSVLEVGQESFDQSIRVNFEAPFDLIRLIAPGMIARGYGRIVNVSSGWGSFHEGLGGPPAYAVSKAALNALTLKASKELPESIKINAMCPGWVRTRMGGQDAVRSPQEGAETAIWLATLADDGPTGGFFRDKQPIQW